VVARAWHGAIHLLVTDIVMPGMSGSELAQAVGEILSPTSSLLPVKGVASDDRLVAIVDDHETMRTAMLELVHRAGIAAVAFPSAEAFLASECAGSISCLILDVQIPGMNGLQLQQHLLDRGLRVPIVFVTVDDDPDIRAHVLGHGAIRVVGKTRLGDDLLDAIQTAFRVDDVVRINDGLVAQIVRPAAAT
jgi:FixJ family two-component response regulator